MINYYFSFIDHTARKIIDYYVILVTDNTERSREEDKELWHQVEQIVSKHLFQRDNIPDFWKIKKIKTQEKVTYTNTSHTGVDLTRSKSFTMCTKKYVSGIKPSNKKETYYYQRSLKSCTFRPSNGQLIPVESASCHQAGGAAYKAHKYKTKYLELKKKQTPSMLL